MVNAGADSTAGTAARRALVVAVQTYLDPNLAARPGTSIAARRIADRLAHAPTEGAPPFEVRALLDDTPDENRRPQLANLLAGLAWLTESRGDALLVVSGCIRDGHFLTRDANGAHLARTTVRLEELAAAAGADGGVIIDGPCAADDFDGVAWAVGASAGVSGDDGAPSRLGTRGPTRFLHAVAAALAGDAAAGRLGEAIRVDDLVAYVRERDPGSWARGWADAPLAYASGENSAACPSCGHQTGETSAAFCPACGAPMRGVELIDRGRYRLIRSIGAGGMGEVYLARDTRLDVERALKLLTVPADLPPDALEVLRGRMIQEARAAQSLADRTHHVVRVFDVGFSPERDQPFLVMELLDGETLGARLSRSVGGQLPPDQAIHLGREVAETLGIAHRQGMVHRDLKPDNVMLVHRDERDDFVKLLDFGLVKMDAARVHTRTGHMMGTLQYMPPEQLRGQKVDARADVFSLGAVLYECLSGVRANGGQTHGEIIACLLERGVEPLATRMPHVDPELAAFVDRCLALRPDARPPDGDAVAAGLRAFEIDRADVGLQPTAAPTPTPFPNHAVVWSAPVASDPPSSPASLARGEVSLAAAIAEVRGPPRWPVATALTVGLALAGWWLWSTPPSTEPPAEDRNAATTASLSDHAWSAVVPDAAVADGALPDALPLRTAASTEDAATVGESPPTSYGDPLRHPNSTLERGEFGVLVRGGAALDRWTRLVIDVSVANPNDSDADALDRWARKPAPVRRWLSDRFPAQAIRTESDGAFRVSASDWAAAREVRPRAQTVRGLGTLLTTSEGDAVFERVNCGTAAPGDQLVTVDWSTRGYGGGQCRGARCPRALARAVQKAAAAAEPVRLRLHIVPAASQIEPATGEGETSDARDDPETKSAVQVVRCRVDPSSAVGGRRPGSR